MVYIAQTRQITIPYILRMSARQIGQLRILNSGSLAWECNAMIETNKLKLVANCSSKFSYGKRPMLGVEEPIMGSKANGFLCFLWPLNSLLCIVGALIIEH